MAALTIVKDNIKIYYKFFKHLFCNLKLTFRTTAQLFSNYSSPNRRINMNLERELCTHFNKHSETALTKSEHQT